MKQADKFKPPDEKIEIPNMCPLYHLKLLQKRTSQYTKLLIRSKRNKLAT